MNGNLALLLFGTHRRDALALLLLHPEDSLHVREIGRITGKAPGTMLRELNRLADAGVLIRRPVGNQVQFQANATCPIYEDLRNILKKTAALADVLRDALEPLAIASTSMDSKPAVQKLRISQTKLAALCRKYGIAKLSLFGSASRNELRPESDVDLMVEFLPDSRASLFDITAMQDEFPAAFGARKVDIVTPDILLNPQRRDSIVPDLKLIYAA